MAEQFRMPPTNQADDQWDKDLHGDKTTSGKEAPTAYDRKGLHRRLHELNDRALLDVPIMPVGSTLEQGAVYIDLNEEHPTEFRAKGDEVAGRANAYVPKREVDYPLWNRLIGVEDPRRLDTGNTPPGAG